MNFKGSKFLPKLKKVKKVIRANFVVLMSL